MTEEDRLKMIKKMYEQGVELTNIADRSIRALKTIRASIDEFLLTVPLTTEEAEEEYKAAENKPISLELRESIIDRVLQKGEETK